MSKHLSLDERMDIEKYLIQNTSSKDKPWFDIKEFKNYYLDHNYNENMFKEDGSINLDYNSYKKTGTIATTFEDHWDQSYKNHKNGFYVYAKKKSLNH